MVEASGSYEPKAVHCLLWEDEAALLQFGFTQRSEEPVSRRTVMSWPGVPISTGESV